MPETYTGATVNGPMPVFAMAHEVESDVETGSEHGDTVKVYTTTIFRLWEKDAALKCRRCQVCKIHEVTSVGLYACAVSVDGKLDHGPEGTLFGQEIGDFSFVENNLSTS